MPLDWTKIDDLNKPPQTAITTITDVYKDPELDALFVEHVESAINPLLTPTQRANVLMKAKAGFRRKSTPDGETTFSLLKRAREFVARFGPTQP